MGRPVYPSDDSRTLRRARARIENQLNHRGIHVTLDNSDETLAELKKQADELQDQAALAGTHAADAEDDRTRANLYSAQAKFLAERRIVMEALLAEYKAREKSGQDSDDPEAVEAKALEFLRHRGWRCDRVDIVPVVIRALEGHPEAREAVLRVVGAGGVKT